MLQYMTKEGRPGDTRRRPRFRDALIAGLCKRGLDFEFDVGDHERHRVHYSYDQFWGPWKVEVDGRIVLKGVRMMSWRLRKSYRFQVGELERHEVVLELTREGYYAGIRPQNCRVFIDGNFIEQHVS
jgi:hypothetical protein